MNNDKCVFIKMDSRDKSKKVFGGYRNEVTLTFASSSSMDDSNDSIKLDSEGLQEKVTVKGNIGVIVCANSKCEQTDSRLSEAPGYCYVYFGLQRNKKKYYVCQQCLQKAQGFREECVRRMKANKSILEIPTQSGMGTVDIDADSDSDDERVHVPLSVKEIATLVNDLIVSTNLQSQTQSCKETLAGGIDKLVGEYDRLEEEIRTIELQVDQARNMYYDSRPAYFGMMKLKAIDIDQYGNIVMSNEQEQPGAALSARHSRKSNNGTRLIEESGSSGGSTTAPKDEAGDVQEVSRINIAPPPKRVLFETPSVIPKVDPKVGDKVYAMKKSSLFGWTLGEVDDITKGSGGKSMFRIKFELKKRVKGSVEMDSYTYKELTAKQLAYNIPCPFILPVGTRVIGLFKDDCAEDEGVPPQDSLYYAGIVAEPPKNTNKYRYLIFFDDGYAQYVETTEVLLVCESSTPVWIDVHPDSQEFIKQYIQKYPERPMVRLTKGTVLSTEWSGKWWLSRVVEVDCSLAKMHFQSDNRFEWIYRGSTRLSPLYNSEKRNAARSEKNATTPTTQRSLPRNNRENKLTIEYLYGNEDVFQKKCKPVARKSTAGGAVHHAVPKIPVPGISVTTAVAPKPSKGSSGIPNHSFLEFEGKMAKIALPSGVAQPKEYENHRCCYKCVIPYDENNAEFKRVNPLAIVLFLGWAREISKFPKRQIFYRAPCGKRLRDFRELHEFLLVANFNLSIDHFCFDQNVDCLSEFQASRVLFSIKDISYGKEIKPVQAINSLDHDYPDYVEYTSERIRGVGVPLELDSDFLVCCDCTDDCQDKTKCACWNLTYEGYRKTREVVDIDKIGYSYRRLKEHIVSGIYECSPRCKCRATCLNKVAQNKMKWILQVFKTSNKGWAIRPLHDIPEGAFICVYAGQLLTEQGANEDGKNFGDEYLAELDFIEVCEKFKEGYEEVCVDPESEVIDVEDENDNGRRSSKRGDDRSRHGDADSMMDEDSCDGLTTARRQPSRFTAKPLTEASSKKKPRIDLDLSTRDYYSKGEQCFIMDAKSIGNIGRYLNHCCSPNVYVQNVFVDTHDVRFPWVAFFAYKTIRAGTEMTWDYNYDIGSVPDKTMYCQCGSPECRGRLL